jgi:hypothetical protein
MFFSDRMRSSPRRQPTPQPLRYLPVERFGGFCADGARRSRARDRRRSGGPDQRMLWLHSPGPHSDWSMSSQAPTATDEVLSARARPPTRIVGKASVAPARSRRAGVLPLRAETSDGVPLRERARNRFSPTRSQTLEYRWRFHLPRASFRPADAVKAPRRTARRVAQGHVSGGSQR